MTCPICNHPDEHDRSGYCEACDDLAQTGQYAPCATPDDGLVLIAGVLYDADTLQEAQ